MSHLLGNIFLAVSAVFFLFTAWLAGGKPAEFAERLGFTLANNGGVNEVRAQYAGFFFAGAVACITAILGVIPQSSAYLLLFVIYGGLISGRFLALVLNGGTNGYPSTIILLHFIDAVGWACAIAALVF